MFDACVHRDNVADSPGLRQLGVITRNWPLTNGTALGSVKGDRIAPLRTDPGELTMQVITLI